MLHRLGWSNVWASLARLGWGLVPLVAIEGLTEIFHTAGWRHCLSGPIRQDSRLRLFWMRLAGYAINYFTPTAALGGEVARANLIASPGRGPEAASAVLIDKGLMAFSHLLLVLAGACFLLWRVALPPTLEIAMLATGALMTAGILIFLLLQQQGRLGSALRWIASKRPPGSRLHPLAAHTGAMDASFRAFYRERRADLSLSLLWHLAGYASALLQTWWFFVLLGQHPGLGLLLAAWTIGLWFDLLVFLVPMSLGTLEASRIATFSAIGYQAVEGMTFGMVMRLGQLAWAILGLFAYAALTWKSPRNG